MTLVRAESQSRIYWAPIVSALVGFCLFQFFGNAARGYVDTPSLFWWWISQWMDPQADTEHGWLILALSGWLFWRNLNEPPRRGRNSAAANADLTIPRSEEDSPAGSNSAGAVLPLLGMMMALVLHAVGFVAQQSRISILALLIFSWAVVALANRRWGRAAAFPLAFMVFAIPLNVLDSIGFWLRLGVIDASALFARTVGIDVVQTGTQLFAADGRFQYDVAAACSGVRSLMALSALSLLIGYVNFRSFSRRGLMLVLCFPLTYLGNVARVAMIIVAAQLGGPEWGDRIHNLMGYGVFVLVLGGVLLAVAAVRRYLPEAPLSESSVASSVGTRSQSPLRGARLAAWSVVTGMVVAEMVFLANISSALSRGGAGVQLDASGANPVALPAFVGTEWIGRQTEVSAVERSILPADTGFSRRTYVSVTDRSHAVFLSIVLSGSDRTSIHRPELCLVGQGWTVSSSTPHAFIFPAGGGIEVPATLLRTSLVEPVHHRKLQALIAYWFVSSDGVVATHWQRFWRDAWARLRHGRVDRWAYVLVQTDAQDGEAVALARMQAVLSETVPQFQRVGL
jgi:EpsI family protein